MRQRGWMIFKILLLFFPAVLSTLSTKYYPRKQITFWFFKVYLGKFTLKKFYFTSICFAKTVASCEEQFEGKWSLSLLSFSALLLCSCEMVRPSIVRCWCAGDSKGEGERALKWEADLPPPPGVRRSGRESSDCIVLLLTSFELPDNWYLTFLELQMASIVRHSPPTRQKRGPGHLTGLLLSLLQSVLT